MRNLKVKAKRKRRQVESDSATPEETGGEGANSDPTPMQDPELTLVAAPFSDQYAFHYDGNIESLKNSTQHVNRAKKCMR